MDLITRLIDLALEEDIGTGDITTDNLIPYDKNGKGNIIAKQPLVIAGLDTARLVFHRLDPSLQCRIHFNDGDTLAARDCCLTVEGRLQSLLKGERVALNFLQHLSGIATWVRSWVKSLEPNQFRLVDTRKTTPGWRVLEKRAVRAGGAYNHRMGLFDGVLIKNNHIAVCGGISKAISKIKPCVSHFTRIEVEASTLDEVREALTAEADIIMLDNMNIDQIKEAVRVINNQALIEVSGNITQAELKKLSSLGIHIISAGALTHSAPSVDIHMRIQPL